MTKPSWYFAQSAVGAYPLLANHFFDDEVVTYCCECGKQKSFLREKQCSLSAYSCEVCGNAKFRNAEDYYSNSIWHDCIESLFHEEFLLSLEPHIIFDEYRQTFDSTVAINVPKYIDTESNEIAFLYKNIFRISIAESTKLDYEVIANFSITKKSSEHYRETISAKELSNKNPILKHYKTILLQKLKLMSISSTLKNSKNLDQFEFFLQNSHLKSVEFYQWENTDLLPSNTDFSIKTALRFISNGHPEKSIQKSIYENYAKQLRTHNKYNFLYIFAITRCISDVNILRSLIELDLSEHFLCMDNPRKFFPFLELLKNKFTEKQIKHLLTQYKTNERFWLNDSITIFSAIENGCEQLEIKRCRYDVVHDAISTYHSVLIERDMFDTEFAYEEEFINACKSVKNYKVKLPKNGRELYEWSNELANCLTSYGELIKNNQTVVFGFFIENKIKFAVEIDKKIIQASAKNNRKLTEKEQNLLLNWFFESFRNKNETQLTF